MTHHDDQLGAKKAEEYDDDKYREAITPEERDKLNEQKSNGPSFDEIGYDKSSVGDKVYLNLDEETQHDAILKREYRETVNPIEPHLRDEEKNPHFGKSDEERELAKREDEIEMQSDPSEESLAQDNDDPMSADI